MSGEIAPTATRLAYWQRRCRDAERRLEFEQEHNKQTLEWARNAFESERILARRCEFLYGVAIAHGATPEELR
jgi:hypothetical protein